MIIRSEELKKVCSNILFAIDNNSTSQITETLEMYTEDHFLYLAVTNHEYFVKVRVDIHDKVDFKVSVSADLFLKLVSKITSETAEFKVEDNCLFVIGNGTYRLPLIFDGESLLELPEITIDNVLNSFSIERKILNSILSYNSKELSKKYVVANPVQTMYYIDNNGCITFTTGACVNKFSLPTTIKFLLPDKIVKLFKLFSDDNVNFVYGKDSLENGIIQTKVKFYTDNEELTAIISSGDDLISNVPEEAIRNRAFKVYDYSVTLNKQLVLNAIDRMLIFTNKSLVPCGKFTFKDDHVVISDDSDINFESIYYENTSNIGSYSAVFDFIDLKTIISGIKSDYFTFNFGDGQSAVIVDKDIYNVIPECVI